MAKYDLEGNFLGFEDLNEQLLVCKTSNSDIEKLKKFGTTMSNTCQFDMSHLTSKNLFERPSNANIFYELFLIDFNGDLIDVPVLIPNF